MLIVDAFNVLHSVAGAEPRLAGLTLDDLAAALGAGRFASEGVVLVCDGTAGGKGWRSGEEVAPGVRAVMAGPGQDADSAIERLLEDQERKHAAHRCMVASSDRRLKAAAAGVRARWVSSADLIGMIVEDLERAERKRREGTGGRTGNEVRGELDRDAAAYWLREFGVGPGSDGGDRSPLREDSRDRVDADDLDMEKWLRRGGGEIGRKDEDE